LTSGEWTQATILLGDHRRHEQPGDEIELARNFRLGFVSKYSDGAAWQIEGNSLASLR
jgi:hypothetical protein